MEVYWNSTTPDTDGRTYFLYVRNSSPKSSSLGISIDTKGGLEASCWFRQNSWFVTSTASMAILCCCACGCLQRRKNQHRRGERGHGSSEPSWRRTNGSDRDDEGPGENWLTRTYGPRQNGHERHRGANRWREHEDAHAREIELAAIQAIAREFDAGVPVATASFAQNNCSTVVVATAASTEATATPAEIPATSAVAVTTATATAL